MTVKEYLTQAYRIDQRINSKLEQVASSGNWRPRQRQPCRYAHKPNRNTGSMETIICKMIDLENEINHDIDTLVDLKRDIVSIFKRLRIRIPDPFGTSLSLLQDVGADRG
jgi:hypothetical protein